MLSVVTCLYWGQQDVARSVSPGVFLSTLQIGVCREVAIEKVI